MLKGVFLAFEEMCEESKFVSATSTQKGKENHPALYVKMFRTGWQFSEKTHLYTNTTRMIEQSPQKKNMLHVKGGRGDEVSHVLR